MAAQGGGSAQPRAPRRPAVVDEGRLVAPREARAPVDFAVDPNPDVLAGDGEADVLGGAEDYNDYVRPDESGGEDAEDVEDNLGSAAASSSGSKASKAGSVVATADASGAALAGTKGRGGGKRKREENYKRYKIMAIDGVTHIGDILFNANSGSLDAHCFAHGLSMNRTVCPSGSSSSSVSARGRPLGFLVAWVMAGIETDVPDELVQLRRGKGPLSEHVTFDCRVIARCHVEADPAWAAFLLREGTPDRPQLERPCVDGEDAEPQDLA